MTKHNLTDTTFIIPVKIESDDRLRNAITVCCFLLSKFDTNILKKLIVNLYLRMKHYHKSKNL